ncbi:MAG: hypothetical protein AAGF24_02025 [Cyanobacteria bacterium P01_H01_bin.121]
MSAALQPLSPYPHDDQPQRRSRRPSRYPSQGRRRPQRSTAGGAPRKQSSNVRFLQPRPRLPVWLQVAIVAQHLLVPVVILLGGASIATYAALAHLQQGWGHAHDDLQSLRHQELNLMSANAAIRRQLLEQANQDANGLVPAQPGHLFFLKPATQRPLQDVQSSQPEPIQVQKPIGY